MKNSSAYDRNIESIMDRVLLYVNSLVKDIKLAVLISPDNTQRLSELNKETIVHLCAYSFKI